MRFNPLSCLRFSTSQAGGECGSIPELEYEGAGLGSTLRGRGVALRLVLLFRISDLKDQGGGLPWPPLVLQPLAVGLHTLSVS